jgi:peptidylprolyl isomerase
MRHLVPFARRAAAMLLVLAAACLKGTEPSGPSNPATDTYAASLGVNISQMTKLSDDLYVQDLVAGTGTQAAGGKTLSVVYTGWMPNGTKFDSNVGGQAFSFTIGAGGVIPGWEIGLVGVKAGGKRRLVIGSALGYGPTAYGTIPANSTLVFDVQVISVQ